MRVLIKAGARVNLACEDGDTPLLRSCRYLYRVGIECVELLIASGADVNLSFPKGTSPLMSVCRPPRAGYEDTYATAMKLLLKHGAKVNAINQMGYTPLKLAEDADANKLIAILKAAGAK